MCDYFCIVFIDFMLADKELNDFRSMFSYYDFEKNCNMIFWVISNMNEFNSMYKANLTEETKFQLNQVTKIENYFLKEINCIK